MNILLAATELEGYVEASAQASMAANLAASLRQKGHSISVALPLYRHQAKQLDSLEATPLSLMVRLGHSELAARIWQSRSQKGVPLWLIERDEFFHRDWPYGPPDSPYSDNPTRFLFFSHAVAELISHLKPAPEIVHCLDWPTGILPATAKHLGLPFGTVFTRTHDDPQARTEGRDFELTNLPPEYFSPHGVEFYGDLHLTKAGFVFADAITLPTDASSSAPAVDSGDDDMSPVLASLADKVSGIRAGMDREYWNPLTIEDFGKPFSAQDPGGKVACKKALQTALGLSVNKKTPLIALLLSPVHKNESEPLMAAMNSLMEEELQLVVSGTGDAFATDYFDHLADAFPTQLSHQPSEDPGHHFHLLAGADFFLDLQDPPILPEPILQAASMGALPLTQMGPSEKEWLQPITRIKSSAKPKSAKRIPAVALNNIHDAGSILAGVQEALALAKEKERLGFLSAHAMGVEFSWETCAASYLKVYRRVLKER